MLAETRNRGRPRKNNKVGEPYSIRLTDEEIENLIWMSKKTGLKRSDIVREALRMYGNLIKFRN